MSKITLSFDNGPDPDVTPHVLRVLNRYGIHSSFFVVGDKLRDRRKLCERAQEEGHWLGNHTFNHIVPLGLSSAPGIAVSEIARTQELLGSLAHPRKFFRPTGGVGTLDKRLLNTEALEYLRRERFTCVLWNSVPEDWLYPDSWVERALAQSREHEHTLVVLHDLPTGAMKHLEQFITRSMDAGAAFEQGFPRECLLLEGGQLVNPADAYVASPVWEAAAL